MRATYSTKVKYSAVKIHTGAMHDKFPFGRPGTTHKIMKLYNHNTLHTLLITRKMSKGVYRNKDTKCWMLG